MNESAARPTLEDVAASAGVSRASASRALRGQHKVSADTVERVRAAAMRLGYVPNVAARQLASRTDQTPLVGLIVRDGANPVYAQLSSELQQLMRDQGQQLITMSLSNQVAAEIPATVLDSMLSLGVNGLIVATGAVDSVLLERYLHGHVPIIRCGALEESPAIPAVSYDEVWHGREVARFLVAHGHRDVVIVSYNKPESVPQFVRALAMKEELRAAGVTVHHFDDHAPSTRIPRAMAALQGGATAVACADDGWALAMLRALDAEGLNVPVDVSVISVDGAMPGIDLIGLTTLRLPIRQVAEGALRMLTGMLGGAGTEPEHELWRGTIVDRGSVLDQDSLDAGNVSQLSVHRQQPADPR